MGGCCVCSCDSPRLVENVLFAVLSVVEFCVTTSCELYGPATIVLLILVVALTGGTEPAEKLLLLLLLLLLYPGTLWLKSGCVAIDECCLEATGTGLDCWEYCSCCCCEPANPATLAIEVSQLLAGAMQFLFCS